MDWFEDLLNGTDNLHGQAQPSSLTELASRTILNQLKLHIDAAKHDAPFAFGGSIPITNWGTEAICGSDVAAFEKSNTSQGGHNAAKGNMTQESQQQTEVIDLTKDDTQLGTSSQQQGHRMKCSPVTIRWDSPNRHGVISKVTFPCPASEMQYLESLVADCEPASFGRHGEDVFDEDYRKAGKLDESAFCPNFNPDSLGIVESIRKVLLPRLGPDTDNLGVRAELYKLNVSFKTALH